MTEKVMITATYVSPANTFQATVETTSDLPADALGEAACEALRKAWRAGEDPCGSNIVIHLGEKK